MAESKEMERPLGPDGTGGLAPPAVHFGALGATRTQTTARLLGAGNRLQRMVTQALANALGLVDTLRLAGRGSLLPLAIAFVCTNPAYAGPEAPAKAQTTLHPGGR